MNRLKASARFLITLLSLCTAFAASAVTALVQATPQEGAINTSRSNIKNTSREAGGRFDPLTLDLYDKASGRKVASQKLADADGDGRLSELEGAFGFRVLPEGEYVLIVTTGAGTNEGAKPSAGRGEPPAEANAPIKVALTLSGVKGGEAKKEVALTPIEAGAGAARTGLDGKLHTVVEGLSGKVFGPGQTHWGKVLFTADGKSKVKGSARHEVAKSSINNMR
jgi:hypothetical protein